MPRLGVAFFCSGFAALLCQIVWQRMLGIFAGSDSISAALVVGAFLGGLGVGAALGRGRGGGGGAAAARRRAAPRLWPPPRRARDLPDPPRAARGPVEPGPCPRGLRGRRDRSRRL